MVTPGKFWAAILPEAAARLRQTEVDLDQVDKSLLTPDRIIYPEADLLNRPETYVFGVLRHEIGHLKYTDFRLLLEGQKFAQEENYQPLDFATLLNAVEDPRVNNLEMGTSQIAQERFAEIYRENFGPILEQMKLLPLPVQFSMLVNGEWAGVFPEIAERGDFEKLTGQAEERVLEAYLETKAASQRATASPSARESYEIIRDEIWPIYKELIEQYLNQESQDQFQQDQEQAQAEGREGKMTGNFEDLSEEQQREYQKRAREKLEEAEKEFNKLTFPRLMEMEERENGLFEAKSKELAGEELEKAQQLETEWQKAEEVREHQERQEREELRRQHLEQIRRLQERKTGLTEGERRLYDQYHREVRPFQQQLERKIDDIFPPEETYVWKPGFPRGTRIEPKRMAREIATERGRMFRRREIEIETKPAAFSLLIDASGSMNGEKIRNALKGAIMTGEAFEKKNVPFEIIIFNDRPIVLKEFNRPYGGPEKKKVIGMLREVQNTPHCYNTDQGFSVDFAARRLQRKSLELDSTGAMIVYTDGEPNPVAEHSGEEWELQKIVQKWQKRFPVIGGGIGVGMQETINKYYGQSGVLVENPLELPVSLLKILERQFDRLR